MRTKTKHQNDAIHHTHKRRAVVAVLVAEDDEDLQKPYEGSIADFGLWGGYTSDDALDVGEINELIDNA